MGVEQAKKSSTFTRVLFLLYVRIADVTAHNIWIKEEENFVFLHFSSSRCLMCAAASTGTEMWRRLLA